MYRYWSGTIRTEVGKTGTFLHRYFGGDEVRKCKNVLRGYRWRLLTLLYLKNEIHHLPIVVGRPFPGTPIFAGPGKDRPTTIDK